MSARILGLALVAAALAGCAERKAIVIPMKQPARVDIPGAIRTLMFVDVKESRGGLAGLQADKADNTELIKAMMTGEFSSSNFALLNDDLFDMVRKNGKVPAYLGQNTMAADFIQQQVGDPGSIGVVEIEAATAFGDAFSSEPRDITLTDTTWSAGRPNARARVERIVVHRIDVKGSVSATVRIRTPYPDGKVVFEKVYTVPDFTYSSVEAAPRDLFFFGRNEAARQGNAAPTVTEVKAIQFKKLARMLYEDICATTKDEPATLDDRGDRMAYNLLAAGAFPWAETRLRKVAKEGKTDQQAANLYNLGVCWEAQGLRSEAAVKYKAALDLEPGNGTFRRAHDRASK